MSTESEAVDLIVRAMVSAGVDSADAQVFVEELAHSTPRAGEELTRAQLDTMVTRLGISLGRVDKDFTVSSPLSSGLVPYDLPGTAGAVCEACGAEVDEDGHCPRGHLAKFNPNHDARGRFGAGAHVHEKPEDYTSGKIHTSDVKEAARLLSQGKNVELESPRQVSTLLSELKKMGDEAESKGEAAPKFNLCRVSVPGTNLFCADNKGIPRIKMPQLKGEPQPNTPASKLPKDVRGEVNLGDAFTAHLRHKGFKTSIEEEDASYLKSSQSELDGRNVASLLDYLHKGTLEITPLFISRDNYIVDGHHRWAAQVTDELSGDKDMRIPVERVDADIITILNEAIDWTTKMGIPPKASGAGWKAKVWTVMSTEAADQISKGDLLTDPHPIGFWTAPPDPTDGLILIEFEIPSDFDTEEGAFPGGATFEVTSKEGEKITATYRKDFTSHSPVRQAGPVEEACPTCGSEEECEHRRSPLLDDLNEGPAAGYFGGH